VIKISPGNFVKPSRTARSPFGFGSPHKGSIRLWQPEPEEVRTLKALIDRIIAVEKDIQRDKSRLEKAGTYLFWCRGGNSKLFWVQLVTGKTPPDSLLTN